MTGIIVYAQPPVKAKQNVLQDDIGQILIFYSGSVRVSNVILPKFADKMASTANILFNFFEHARFIYGTNGGLECEKGQNNLHP